MFYKNAPHTARLHIQSKHKNMIIQNLAMPISIRIITFWLK